MSKVSESAAEDGTRDQDRLPSKFVDVCNRGHSSEPHGDSLEHGASSYDKNRSSSPDRAYNPSSLDPHHLDPSSSLTNKQVRGPTVLDASLLASDEMKRGCSGHSGLGQWISPPTNAISPPDVVLELPCDPDFMERFNEAYKLSRLRDTLRARNYGDAVASDFRRGLTPEACRAESRALAEQARADLEASSDSE